METPARRQYLELKAQHPDALLLYRMGDFYELFDDDAKVAARELKITLTSREFGKGRRVPMAGIPYHALQSYLRRLIAKGYRVAICEQLSEPGRGLVERAVVRVVSPGTVAEPGLLVGHENNYLAAVHHHPEAVGLAYVDVTTGEFLVTELRGPQREAQLAAELHRIRPSECLCVNGQPQETLVGHLTPLDSAEFDPLSGRDLLCRHFNVRSLEGFGCAELPYAIGAAGAILRFLERTNPALLATLEAVRTYHPDTYLVLDPATRRNLELTRSARSGQAEHSLVAAVDLTRTPMGGRLLRRFLGQPLRDRQQIAERLDAIEELIADHEYRRVASRVLRALGDLERVIGRIRQRAATPREVLHLREALERLPDLRQGLEARGSFLLRQIGQQLDPCLDVAAFIGAALAEDGGRQIRPGFNRELDLLSELLQSSRRWMTELEQRERARTGIRSLKVGYNKVFGYYIEVSNPNLAQVPDDYIRKQTLANAERFVTEELKEMEARILSAEARVEALERELFEELLEQLARRSERLLAAARAVALLDVLVAWADLAAERGYVRPELADDGPLEIEGGRHPVVETRLGAQEFVPNDCRLGGEHGTVLLVTGPNMAGKSTYLRQVALIVLLAQAGCFVPARRARIALVDRIFSRVGAQDDLAAGASTFLVEMAETANILRHASERSLVILDEIGRGTSTYDGLALAQAVLEDLHDRIGARTLFATHYHELTRLADELPRLRNVHAAASDEGGRLIFHYRILPGASDRSYGIQVARLAGLPAPVIRRAERLLQLHEERAQAEPRRALAEPRAAFAEPSPAAAPLPLDGLAAELLGLDLVTTTPLEALQVLHRLQVRAREGCQPPGMRNSS